MAWLKDEAGSYRPIDKHSESEASIQTAEDRLDYGVRRRTRPDFVSIYLAITTTILCLLVITDIVLRNGHCGGPSSGREEIETTYGRNAEYMTLAHSHDYLWEADLSGADEKIIELGEDGETLYDVNGHDMGSPASISM